MRSYQKFFEDNSDNTNKGVLFIEKEDGSNNKWLLVIDISEIWWNLQNKMMTEDSFSMKLCGIINDNEDSIKELCGNLAWEDINDVLLKLNNTNEQKTINKLYDLCDEYDIQLKTDKQDFNESFSSDIYAKNDLIVIDYKGKEHTAKIKDINTESSFNIEITDDLSLRGVILTIDISNIISLTQKGSIVTGDSQIRKGKREPYSNDMVL